MTPTAGLALLTALWPAAAPAEPTELVLNCYVVQSSAVQLGQFVRHLRIDEQTRSVSISDGLRGGGVRFVGDGSLVELSPDRIVYDYVSAISSGRTVIDRRNGRFHYSDGRSTVTGTCEPGGG